MLAGWLAAGSLERATPPNNDGDPRPQGALESQLRAWVGIVPMERWVVPQYQKDPLIYQG